MSDCSVIKLVVDPSTFSQASKTAQGIIAWNNLYRLKLIVRTHAIHDKWTSCGIKDTHLRCFWRAHSHFLTYLSISSSTCPSFVTHSPPEQEADTVWLLTELLTSNLWPQWCVSNVVHGHNFSVSPRWCLVEMVSKLKLVTENYAGANWEATIKLAVFLHEALGYPGGLVACLPPSTKNTGTEKQLTKWWTQAEIVGHAVTHNNPLSYHSRLEMLHTNEA